MNDEPNGQEAEDYGYEKFRQERVDEGTWRPYKEIPKENSND